MMAPLPQMMSMAAASSLDARTNNYTASVTLAWDHSPDTNVVGYRLYYGPRSGDYTNSVVVGYTTLATLTGLPTIVTNYFAATAYDTNGEESVFSNETSYTAASATPGVTLEMFPYVFQLRWQCVPLKTNILQVSTNLSVWLDIPGRSYYRTNVETITVLATNTTPHSFYRVRIQQ